MQRRLTLSDTPSDNPLVTVTNSGSCLTGKQPSEQHPANLSTTAKLGLSGATGMSTEGLESQTCVYNLFGIWLLHRD